VRGDLIELGLRHGTDSAAVGPVNTRTRCRRDRLDAAASGHLTGRGPMIRAGRCLMLPTPVFRALLLLCTRRHAAV